ncbi:hypothetical protein F8388_024126 [Cannabis sativa]|uniref:Polyprotein n=1 Tax=Cannabis sativa TaxID=3483 RepID=A0A7J6FY22_CANSA|nr:hypothetical protein F8388_024126 [Cannabis sativa]KAF4383411.1 hypothetical protein G4B88_023985 [Cannabis sativa]
MTTPSDIIESSSQLSTHTTPVSMPLTASPSLRRSSASKLDALYEVSYLSDDGKVILSDIPLINPYQAFSKPQSLFTRSIKTLIKQNPKTVKEYVQSTKFDQCNLPATEQEQLVTLQIPPEFPQQWIDQGLTHIHFGAVRLALTHHGRKGLPVCARITLLDTRMKKFQHASIGTLEATLNAGTVIVTFYPNFCMSLRDKRLLDALKVQLQIVGIDQDPDSLGSTLHYQMAYRVQNHAIDISIPGSSDALMITIDTNHVPICIHIPRQITTEELQQILPTSWITNYEKTQKPLPSVHSADPVFKSKKDGSIEISFPKNETTPRVFSTQYIMSTIIPEAAEISSFDKNGSPIYAFKSTSGHIYWDICNCFDCTTSNEQEEAPKKKSAGKKLKKNWENGQKDIGPLGEPSGKFDYLVKYSSKPILHEEIQPTGWECDDDEHKPLLPCYKPKKSKPHLFMLKGSKDKFPLPCSFMDETGKITHQPKVLNLNIREADGTLKKITPAEAALNWQTDNMLAQNKTLQQIDEKLSTVTHKVIKINEVFSKFDTVMTRLVYKISQVHEELLQMVKSKQVPQEIFLAKEAELKGLKSQYVSMQTQSKDGLPLTASLDSTPWMFSTLPKSAQPLASPPKMGDQILRLKRILDEEDQLKRKKKQDNQGQYSTQLMVGNRNDITDIIHQHCLNNLPQINLNEEISSDDESSDDDEISSSPSQSDDWETDDQSSSDKEAIPPQFMTTNHTTAASGVEREQNFDPTEPIIEEEVSSEERHKSTKHQFSGKPNTFMLDDLPPNQWRSRFQEFRAWTLLEAQKPRAEIRDILLQLVSRFTGILQDWWQSLGEYRQLQFLQADSIEAALNHLYGGLFNMHAFPAGQPIPIAKMHVIPTKYSRPIKVAAFFDTGASYTIINPDILPPELWKKKKQYFHVANNQVLRT